MDSDTFILVVCPQPILRYALCTTFSGNGIKSVERGTWEDGIRILAESSVSMVLLDMQALSPASEALQYLQTLRTRFPNVAIILLTDDGAAVLNEALESIADGAVSKDDHPQAFLDLCSWVRNGGNGFWISPTVAAAYLRRRLVAIRHRLTDRELHVLHLLERSNGEIATDLHLAVGTVKNYVSTLYDKLGVRSRAEALKFRSQIGPTR